MRLGAVLPADAIVGMTWGPFRYRRYAVFSLRWLAGRLVFFTAVVALYSLLTVLGQHAAGQSWGAAWAATGYMAAGMLLLFTVGPALATWVRHRGLPRGWEGALVVVAALAGFVAGLGADVWASSKIKGLLTMKEVAASERKISDLDEATLMLGRSLGGILYFSLGGGLATLAYFSERRRLKARRRMWGSWSPTCGWRCCRRRSSRISFSTRWRRSGR